jgi:hypothetical protein
VSVAISTDGALLPGVTLFAFAHDHGLRPIWAIWLRRIGLRPRDAAGSAAAPRPDAEIACGGEISSRRPPKFGWITSA